MSASIWPDLRAKGPKMLLIMYIVALVIEDFLHCSKLSDQRGESSDSIRIRNDAGFKHDRVIIYDRGQ